LFSSRDKAIGSEKHRFGIIDYTDTTLIVSIVTYEFVEPYL